MFDWLRGYVPFYKRNLKLAYPVMLSQLGQVVVMFADSMMVGRMGEVELAAVSFANAIVMIGMLFVLGISFGSTPLVGTDYVSGSHRKSATTFQNSFLLNFISAFFVCSVLLVVSLFMDRMGQEEGVCRLAVPYYRIVVVSLFPLMVFQAFKQFMEGVGDTKNAMVITIVANVINIIFNYLLIFGKFGFPELGVNGAGWATFISRLLMPVMFLFVFWKSKSLVRYFYFFRLREFRKDRLLMLCGVGLPIGLQMLIEGFTFSMSAVMVGWFGADMLSGHQIAWNISSMTFMVTCGISAATTIRVSHQLGAGDFVSLRKAGFASMHLSAFFSMLMACLIVLFRYEIAELFIENSSVIEIAAELLVLVAVFQLADGLQCVSLGALRGLSDVNGPMVIATVCYILVNLPIAYVLGVVCGFEANGVWAGFIFGLNLAAVLLIYRFVSKTKCLANDMQQGAFAN